MSPASRWRGVAVSDGAAAGRLYLADVAPAAAATPEDVRAAFAGVAAQHAALADRLRGAGRGEEADIVAVGGLIASDPALVGPAVAAARDGADAVAAVQGAAETQAAQLEALPVPELAERAGDVRQIARAVLEQLGAGPPPPPEEGDFILARREIAAYDLISLAEHGLVGAASVAGGASSHAAIVARGLGVPMLTGIDPGALAAPPDSQAILDADAGELIVGAGPEEIAAVRARPDAAAAAASPAVPPARAAGASPARPPARAAPASPQVPGRRPITILCNVASAAETRRGLADGAAGVGLLRTEIAFAGATAWPSYEAHLAQLGPVLGQLDGRPAVVRLLDFSGDKIPPFLRGQAGLSALLGHPTALRDQLRAVLEAGRLAELAILVPMVRDVAEVETVAAALADAAAAAGTGGPRLGIMVEVASTAADAAAFAPHVAFFSIGTNDLTSEVLGIDRQDQRSGPALTADPRVLALVARVVGAGRAAGVSVSVCGDAAADPAVIPLLVGLGADALSVPAARVARVRERVAELDRTACATLADDALRAATVAEVWDLVGAG